MMLPAQLHLNIGSGRPSRIKLRTFFIKAVGNLGKIDMEVKEAVLRVLYRTSHIFKKAKMCFFVLCNRHRFNRVPGPAGWLSWGLPIYPPP
jgi:hypothetical protein